MTKGEVGNDKRGRVPTKLPEYRKGKVQDRKEFEEGK